MRLQQLLWSPLPDPLPTAGRDPGRLARLPAAMRSHPANRSCRSTHWSIAGARRGAVQALVREAYQRTVAEQDSARRKPDAFTQAWRAHLADFLGQVIIEQPEWNVITVATLDVSLLMARHIASKAHLPTSASLSGPGYQTRYPASYPGRPLEERPRSPGFLSAFACRHWLLGHPLPARGFRFPHGRPTGPDYQAGLCRGSRVPHA